MDKMDQHIFYIQSVWIKLHKFPFVLIIMITQQTSNLSGRAAIDHSCCSVLTYAALQLTPEICICCVSVREETCGVLFTVI